MTNPAPLSLKFIQTSDEDWHSFAITFAGDTTITVRINHKIDSTEIVQPEPPIDKSTRENLLLAVKAFNHAGLILMHEDGPVTAVEPCFVPAKMRPIMLNAEGVDAEGMYLFGVVFQLENSQIQHLFNVDPKSHSVDYDDTFYDAMGKTTSLVRPLFSAIAHFCKAAHPHTADIL